MVFAAARKIVEKSIDILMNENLSLNAVNTLHCLSVKIAINFLTNLLRYTLAITFGDASYTIQL